MRYKSTTILLLIIASISMICVNAHSATLTYKMPDVGEKKCNTDIFEEMYLQKSAFRDSPSGCNKTVGAITSNSRLRQHQYESKYELTFKKFNSDFGSLQEAYLKVEVWRPYFYLSADITHRNNEINGANPWIRVEGQATTAYDIKQLGDSPDTVRFEYYNDDRISLYAAAWEDFTSCQNREGDNAARCPDQINSQAFRWFWRDICFGCNQDDEAERTIALEIRYPDAFDANSASCALEEDETDKWCAGNKLFSEGQRLADSELNKKHRTLMFDLDYPGEKDPYIGNMPIYFGLSKFTCFSGDSCASDENDRTRFKVVQRPKYKLLLEGYKYVFATDKNGPGCGLWDDGIAPVDDYQACFYNVRMRAEAKDQVSVVYEYAPNTAVPVDEICGDDTGCVYTESDTGEMYLVPILVNPNDETGPVVNLKSRWTEVAMISNARFSADSVDVGKVRFGPGEAEAWGYNDEDVNEDGVMDRVLQFLTNDTGIECGDLLVTMTGAMPTGDGISEGNFFFASDEISVINNYGETQGRKEGSDKGKKVGWNTAFCN